MYFALSTVRVSTASRFKHLQIVVTCQINVINLVYTLGQNTFNQRLTSQVLCKGNFLDKLPTQRQWKKEIIVETDKQTSNLSLNPKNPNKFLYRLLLRKSNCCYFPFLFFFFLFSLTMYCMWRHYQETEIETKNSTWQISTYKHVNCFGWWFSSFQLTYVFHCIRIVLWWRLAKACTVSL